jgi:adhesin transport system outer membrane protein
MKCRRVVGLRGAVALIAITSFEAAMQPALATSLRESVENAVVTNPEIGEVRADRQAVDQELRQARALYLPSIDLRAAAGPEYSNNPATRLNPDDGSASTLARLESQLTLTQVLFDGFARESELERQLARVDSASQRVQETAEFVGLDAVEAHLDVLRNQAIVTFAEANLEQHRIILGKVNRLVDQGVGSIADVSQAQARFAAAETALARANGDLRDAIAVYLAIVGIPPSDLEEPIPPEAALPVGVEAAADRAAVANPSVEIAAADVKAVQAQLKGARSGFYPRFNLELGTNANRNIDGIEGSEVDASALVVMRYNLFRGGADVAREREAFARVKEAQAALDRAQRQAEREARVSYNARLTARDRVRSLQRAADAQLATRNAYSQQFDLGQRSLLDLLDAENELFLARTTLTTAIYTEIFAVYRILAVVGDLLAELEVEPPKETIDIYREPGEPIHEVYEPAPEAGLGAPDSASRASSALRGEP